MARTHRSLEGKEIVYIDGVGLKHRGIITGCNKYIGISIQDAEDMDRYLYCLVCEMAPNFNNSKGEIKKTRKRYKEVVAELMNGKFSFNGYSSEKASISTCPFSQ